MQAKDWRGTEIKVGSTVVYPSRQSSSIWMSEGEVVSVERIEHPYQKSATMLKVGVRKTRGTGHHDGAGQRISYPDPERITVIA